MLFFFRFPEVHYAVSYTAGMALDFASLMETAIDEKEFAWLQESGPVAELWEASLLLLGMVYRTFGHDVNEKLPPPSESDVEKWRRRYHDVIALFANEACPPPPIPTRGPTTTPAFAPAGRPHPEVGLRHAVPPRRGGPGGAGHPGRTRRSLAPLAVAERAIRPQVIQKQN